ncbi:MAG: phage minor head protein, partial [Terriglobia bacterium]
QQEAALKEGLSPLLLWLKELMDELLVLLFDSPQFEFVWAEEEALDPASQATILTDYLKTGVLTINEVRAKLGEDPTADGDQNLIYSASGAIPLAQVGQSAVEPPLEETPVTKAALPSPQKKKLTEALEVALEEAAKAVAGQIRKLGKASDTEKGIDAASAAQSADLTSLSLAWDDYTQTLAVSAEDGRKLALVRIKVKEPDAVTDDMLDSRDPRAVTWAEEHAGEMLTKDGTGGKLVDATRDMIRSTLAKGIEDKLTVPELADKLQNDYAFSPARAELIATTEIRLAEGHGLLTGYRQAGMKFKKWLLSNDDNPCLICIANADAGYIPIDDDFMGGVEAPLQHPNCRCDLIASRTGD